MLAWMDSVQLQWPSGQEPKAVLRLTLTWKSSVSDACEVASVTSIVRKPVVKTSVVMAAVPAVRTLPVTQVAKSLRLVAWSLAKPLVSLLALVAAQS